MFLFRDPAYPMVMLIPLLSLALAVIPAAPASAMSGPRSENIRIMASGWTTYRNSAMRMMTNFPALAAKDGVTGDLHKLMRDLRALTAEIEDVQAGIFDVAKETIRESESPSAARLDRERAAVELYEVRMLAVYGNMIPRVLDEAFVDRRGVNYGREYCGPEWAIALTWDELVEYSRELKRRTGLTDAQYDAFEDRVRASRGLPPADRR